MSLADELRAQAIEERATANTIVTSRPLIKTSEAPDGTLELDAKNLLVAVIGHVNATIFEQIADLMDYQRITIGEDSTVARQEARAMKYDAIRRAAAAQDWTTFDELVGSGEV